MTRPPSPPAAAEHSGGVVHFNLSSSCSSRALESLERMRALRGMMRLLGLVCYFSTVHCPTKGTPEGPLAGPYCSYSVQLNRFHKTGTHTPTQAKLPRKRLLPLFRAAKRPRVFLGTARKPISAQHFGPSLRPSFRTNYRFCLRVTALPSPPLFSRRWGERGGRRWGET